jgi:ABC-type multidrug transport system fused ATPase/permease subunit
MSTEEPVHKPEETNLVDEHEPNPKSIFQIPILKWELLWILFGAICAGAQGAVPIVFYYVLGNSFGDIASATPEQIGQVTSMMALNITYIAIGAGVASALASFFFTYGSQRIGIVLRQEYFNQVVSVDTIFLTT